MKFGGNKGSERSGNNTQYLWLTLAAGIPVFLAANTYTSASMNRHTEQTAFLITVYFLMGIYMGRYLSQIWINKYKEIPRSFFTWLIIIILVSAILLFITASLSLRIQIEFIAMLLVGLPLLVLSVATGILIKTVRTTIKSQLQDARADAAQSQSELKLLQSQLSPHFLFNTLNNIYGISLSRHENVPPLLLKLSDLLRYSVYEAREQLVPLQSEMAYIHNYIDFEKIRIGEKLKLTTEFDYHIDPKIQIAPLLLIVFIENAFKHAKNTTEQDIYIDIRLKIWGHSILFSVKNSNKGMKGEKGILNTHSGFGLDNVRKRLELLYKDQYTLSIEDSDEFYTVMLQLKAK